MEGNGRIIVVAGATGHQGGASTRHLLEHGWRVRAITRHPDSDHARMVAGFGAEIVQADLLDRSTLDGPLEGAYGVHSVETFREAGMEGEIDEGRNLVDAARAAGVRHFTYDSVIGADQADPPAGWVKSKHELEGYLRDSGLPYTIWRPATFMENFLGQRDDIAAGVMTGMGGPDEMRQLIAVDDIGRFVALGFTDPDTWLGKTTEIAGDRMTNAKVAETFARVLGRSVDYLQTPPPQAMPPSAPPKQADLEMLRAALPGLRTLEDWAREVDWHRVAEPVGRMRE
jgi:uncharacterized protein YbjT (DUF2867 family)